MFDVNLKDTTTFSTMFRVILISIIHMQWKFPLYRNQSNDFHGKSIDWFLYDGNLDHKWISIKVPTKFFGFLIFTLNRFCVISSLNIHTIAAIKIGDGIRQLPTPMATSFQKNMFMSAKNCPGKVFAQVKYKNCYS